MEVVGVPLGPQGSLEVDVLNGQLIIKISNTHASGSVSLVAQEDLKYFLELLKPKLPSWAQIAVAAVEGSLP